MEWKLGRVLTNHDKRHSVIFSPSYCTFCKLVSVKVCYWEEGMKTSALSLKIPCSFEDSCLLSKYTFRLMYHFYKNSFIFMIIKLFPDSSVLCILTEKICLW